MATARRRAYRPAPHRAYRDYDELGEEELLELLERARARARRPPPAAPVAPRGAEAVPASDREKWLVGKANRILALAALAVGGYLLWQYLSQARAAALAPTAPKTSSAAESPYQALMRQLGLPDLLKGA